MPSSAPSTDLSGKQKTAAALLAACLIAAPLTAAFEGLRTKPYHDPGDGRRTVCYGETEREMKNYTADECRVLLEARQRKDYAPAVLKCVPGLINKPNAFAASIDAAYNAGTAAFCRSPMAKRFNEAVMTADPANASALWLVGCESFRGWYVTAKGKRLSGLVRRRDAEAELCGKDAGGS